MTSAFQRIADALLQRVVPERAAEAVPCGFTSPRYRCGTLMCNQHTPAYMRRYVDLCTGATTAWVKIGCCSPG